MLAGARQTLSILLFNRYLIPTHCSGGCHSRNVAQDHLALFLSEIGILIEDAARCIEAAAPSGIRLLGRRASRDS